MNFLQISQKTNTLCGLQGSLSSASAATGYQATLVEFIKQAWTDIQDLRKDWPFLRSSTSFSTVASQSEYTLTEIFGASHDFARYVPGMILYIDGDDHVSHLRKYTYDQYIYWEVANQDTGLPDIYAEDPVDRHLYINPPITAYTIQVHYYTQPVELTENTDVPLLPLSYHMLIAYQAAAHMSGFMGNANLFQINQQKADAMLGMLMRTDNPAKKVRTIGIA